MGHFARSCAIALSCPLAVAQGYFTSPAGFLDKDGGNESTISHPLEGTTSRNQYIDGDQRGPARTISKLEMRRDAYLTPSTSFNARTAMAAVVMSHCDFTLLTTTFASNYLGGASVVMQRRAIAFPAAVQPPPTGPAPWSLAYVFDAPFAYNGTQDLLWEIQTDTPSTTNPYPLDVMSQPFAPGFGFASYTDPLGTCTTPNGKFNIYYPQSPGTGGGIAQLKAYANGGPSNAVAVLALGLTDAGLFGLFCAPLRTSAEVTIPTSTGTGGSVPTQTVQFPWSGGLLQVFAQFAAVTAASQLYLSDGIRFLITNDSYSPKLGRLTAGSPTATTGSRYTSVIPVTRFTY